MTLILQLVFLVIPLLFVGFGVLIGRRLKWQFSVGKIAVIAVSAVIPLLPLIISPLIYTLIFKIK